ncbi:carbohydrate-binding module family 13 protein [Pluteus cervinus]|uniref:Carbohydrate-binding module family 13 protein n=1 Tax=Pluteus cervinus TaxID=181527 RepID=A0ACD3A7M2_9AGAR|nr:carbohydrate-binding module family 13 protein [Pluteus cervinus]
MIGQKTLVLSILATTLSALALNLPVASSPLVPAAQVIKPGGDMSKCLEVAGADYENGVPVELNDCNGAANQYWLLKAGETKIQANGTNYCLDAGSSPQSGVGLKIWQCYDNLAAQDWYFTDDHRIALNHQSQCVDLTNGNFTNGNQVQTWDCTTNNHNQYWNLQ